MLKKKKYILLIFQKIIQIVKVEIQKVASYSFNDSKQRKT